MDKHTPTPWSYLPHYGSNVIYKMQLDIKKGPHKGIARTIKDTDAAFIVRAVNCHEELLRLLKVCLEEMLADGWSHESLEDVEQAIAKAEGK